MIHEEELQVPTRLQSVKGTGYLCNEQGWSLDAPF